MVESDDFAGSAVLLKSLHQGHDKLLQPGLQTCYSEPGKEWFHGLASEPVVLVFDC